MTHRKGMPWIVALALVLVPTAQGSVRSAAAPAKGKLLVASEDLFDPSFVRTVLLLLDYDESGALGVVLNRPTQGSLEDLLPDVEWAAQSSDPIYLGGPVGINQALMLSSTGQEVPDQRNVVGKVHAGWSLELLERLVVDPRPQEKYRVFVGYAGWAPGQLDAEIERGGWHVFPSSEAAIFSDVDDALWHEYIERTRSRIASAETELAQHEP